MNKLVWKITTVLLSSLILFSYSVLPQGHLAEALATEVTETVPEGTDAESTETPSEPAAITDPNAPAIVANSAIVIDAKTGHILYGKNEHARCYPASITKVMTCMVALEHVNLNDTITFSENAIWGIERDSNHIALDVGEQITAEQCLYAVMLQSANEASWGIAEHVSGSLEDFTNLMNAKALALGCKDTNFVNANGLHDENHYTTAYDMALIMKAAVQNPMFLTITETKYYQIPPTNLCEEQRDLWHQLKMLYPTSSYYYEPVVSGKTGFTDQAHNTLVTYAEKNGMELICVILDCEGAANGYNDSIALYDYYFNNYTYAYPLQTFNPNTQNHTDYIVNNFYRGLDHNTLNLTVDNDLAVVVPRNMDAAALTTQTSYYTTLEDNIVGKVSVLYNGTVLGESDIQYSDMTINGEVLRWGFTPEEKKKRTNITLIVAISVVVVVAVGLFIVFRFKTRRYRYLKRRSRSSRLHW